MHIHIHNYNHADKEVLKKLDSIHSLLNKIKMTQEELAAELAALKLQEEKAKTEIIAKIAELEQAIVNAGTVSPEVQSALNELKASVQSVDDILPDAPPV